MLEWLSWAFTAIALYGTWLNANQKKNGFILWVAADIFFAIANVFYGFWAQSFLFCVYTFLALWGYFKWKTET